MLVYQTGVSSYQQQILYLIKFPKPGNHPGPEARGQGPNLPYVIVNPTKRYG